MIANDRDGKMRALNRSKVVPFLKIAAVYVLLVVGIYLLPEKIAHEMVKENGLIEVLSAAGYFLLCVFLIRFNYTGAIKTGFAPVFFLFFLGLRELDFHVRFTTMGIFKTKFFVSPQVPFTEKIIVTLFILSLIAYGVIYLRRTLPGFKKDLPSGWPYAFSIVAAVGCVFISKLLDGNSKIFEALFPMLENPRMLSVTMEECLEMFIPVFFIRALFQYRLDIALGHAADNYVKV
jgi:hypothetical protein